MTAAPLRTVDANRALRNQRHSLPVPVPFRKYLPFIYKQLKLLTGVPGFEPGEKRKEFEASHKAVSKPLSRETRKGGVSKRLLICERRELLEVNARQI